MIHILPPEVYNRIAAGEVVDRPYSVVKELVENAIDAGASEIKIEIEGGGKKLIRITDNGYGIAKDDLAAAFHSHATSKLMSAEDLARIATLGFRGEAVASIASVSKMNITSKTQDSMAYSLSSCGGELGTVAPAAGADGTCVTVEDLFFKVPARLKFLKSDGQEEGDVSNMVARLILSRPSISFTYLVNGKVRFRSFGDGRESAVAVVYGAKTVENCYEVSAEKHGLRLEGFLGNPNFAKPNRTYQSFFVNGRYVQNQTLSSAVANAYSSYLMKRQYPFYVLYLQVPPEILDVNVHPNKADVRFSDNQIIYGVVYSIISAILDGNSRALEYLAKPFIQAENPENAESIEKTAGSVPPSAPPAQPLASGEKEQMSYEKAKEEIAFQIPALPKGRTFFGRPTQKTPFELSSPPVSVLQEDDPFEENRRALLMREEKAKQEKVDVRGLVFKGELFHTYLIYESGDEAYLIDQHAAHERLLFDRLNRRLEKEPPRSQPMLLPYIKALSPQEFAFLTKNFDILRSFGFEIEEFGMASVKISAVPVDLFGMNVERFLQEVLSSMDTLRAVKLSEIVRDRLASMACKAAVKGGEELNEEEVERLIQDLNGDMGLKCPHGRPACIKVKRGEIEKLFKRIV